jgi:hypothetical protein
MCLGGNLGGGVSHRKVRDGLAQLDRRKRLRPPCYPGMTQRQRWADGAASRDAAPCGWGSSVNPYTRERSLPIRPALPTEQGLSAVSTPTMGVSSLDDSGPLLNRSGPFFSGAKFGTDLRRERRRDRYAGGLKCGAVSREFSGGLEGRGPPRDLWQGVSQTPIRGQQRWRPRS